MKKSKQVMLTTVFLSAVSAYSSSAKDIGGDWRRDAAKDSTESHHNSYTTTHTGGHGLFSFLHHHNNQGNAPAGGQSHSPRTRGFGNTLRSSGS